MKKLAFVVFSLIAAQTMFAQMIPLTPEIRDMRMRQFGGDIPDRRKQKGELCVVNAQCAVDDKVIRAGVNKFEEDLLIGIKFEKGDFNISNPSLKGTATVFVVDDPTLPMSLVAPEARWAVANVSSLKTAKAAFLEARVKKLLYRVVGELCGASATKYDRCIFGAITKPEDLDEIAEVKLPLEYWERFKKYLPEIGIVPYRMVRYSKACQQGWAPAPTNEYQKAVWDKVHEIPSDPIKIKFDPKRDK